MTAPSSILISRTDSIGDVVLTLPLAKLLRDRFPQARIGFLGKAYTRAVIEACRYVDVFVHADDFLDPMSSQEVAEWDCIVHVFPDARIAQKAKEFGIKERIGTTNRLYHWWTCNRLVRLGRKKSPLHEAQLNTTLLRPLGIEGPFSLDTLGQAFGLEAQTPLPADISQLLAQHPDRKIILHPKSQGSAREWGLEHFATLAKLLYRAGCTVFISGTDKERLLLEPLFEAAGDVVIDVTGRMNLNEFLSFIDRCDGLVANSTGPLHLAAALGKIAVGIYPPMRPIHPGRWAPIGPKASYLVHPKPDCNDCRKAPSACTCIKAVEAAIVAERVLRSMG